jgi:prevent-host-death family protein
VSIETQPKTFTATEFRAKCFRILDELDHPGIVITKRGRPVAKVTPIKSVDNSKFFGCMKGKIAIKGDIFSTGVKWNAQS